MRIETFDRELAQAHLDSHEDADYRQGDIIAYRLHKPKAAEQPEPFRITGPVRYQMRNGGVVMITDRQASGSYPEHVWRDNFGFSWRDDGRYGLSEENERDLIARLPDEPEQEKSDTEKLTEHVGWLMLKLNDVTSRLTALEQTVNGEKGHE